MKKDWMVKESQLDSTQLEILMATLDKSCIITGCAGSGKSVLALIKAQRIQKEKGKNYQTIVFTKALRSYMDAGKTELGLENGVYYHWEWNNVGCPSADYTVVDEVQDFDSTEIEAFVKSTKKTFFFFGDTTQSIYKGILNRFGQRKDPVPVERIKDIPMIRSLGIAIKEYRLFYNYRLPVPVAEIAQHIGVGLESLDRNKYKSQETNMPRFLQYPKERQMEKIHAIITQNNLTDVAILLPDNESVRNAYGMLRQLGNYEFKIRKRDNASDFFTDPSGHTAASSGVDTLNFKTTNPKVMTYWSAKGLQFETVFLPWIDSVFSYGDSAEKSESKRKALYVAMTRTYKNLYVLYDSVLPAPLSDIPPALYKTAETDVTEDI